MLIVLDDVKIEQDEMNRIVSIKQDNTSLVELSYDEKDNIQRYDDSQGNFYDGKTMYFPCPYKFLNGIKAIGYEDIQQLEITDYTDSLRLEFFLENEGVCTIIDKEYKERPMFMPFHEFIFEGDYYQTINCSKCTPRPEHETLRPDQISYVFICKKIRKLYAYSTRRELEG